MKIIGHRGAAGLALENTRASLLAAIHRGVDMIEFDVRLTADDHLVICHDAITDRISAISRTIRRHTLKELQSVELHGGQHLLSLDEGLEIAGSVPVIIEVKDSGSVGELLTVLKRHPDARPSIASFEHSELHSIRKALPEIPIYVLEHFAPFDIVHSAHRLHATGIGLNRGLMNPLTYILARRNGLELYLYSVNNVLLARFLHLFYPGVSLCTDHPERFIKH